MQSIFDQNDLILDPRSPCAGYEMIEANVLTYNSTISKDIAASPGWWCHFLEGSTVALLPFVALQLWGDKKVSVYGDRNCSNTPNRHTPEKAHPSSLRLQKTCVDCFRRLLRKTVPNGAVTASATSLLYSTGLVNSCQAPESNHNPKQMSTPRENKNRARQGRTVIPPLCETKSMEARHRLCSPN